MKTLNDRAKVVVAAVLMCRKCDLPLDATLDLIMALLEEADNELLASQRATAVALEFALKR